MSAFVHLESLPKNSRLIHAFDVMTGTLLYVDNPEYNYIFQYQPSLITVEMTKDEEAKCKFNYLSVPIMLQSAGKMPPSSEEITRLIGHVRQMKSDVIAQMTAAGTNEISQDAAPIICLNAVCDSLPKGKGRSYYFFLGLLETIYNLITNAELNSAIFKEFEEFERVDQNL